MGINRLSTYSMMSQSIYHLHNNQNLMAQLQEKLSSGRNINRPSDDPVGLTRILDIANTISNDDRYMKNIDNALSELNIVDSTISNITDSIQRAHELAVQGANFSNNQQGLDAIALEIDEIINQMVQLGNTSISGKYVFGGFQTANAPFARVGNNVTYSGTPAAANFGRPVEVAEGVTVDININGEALLGRDTVVNPVVPPVFAAGSTGLFRTLTELKLDLEQGNQDEVRLRLDELTADLNNVLAEHARVGSIVNRLQMTKERYQDRKAILTQEYSSIQDIDMAKTISDMNFQESIFQASLAVTARVLQPSLMNFLR